MYANVEDINRRHEADKVLINKALERLKAKDASVGEKVAALIVIPMMKAKVKMGMGVRRSIKKKKSSKGRILVAPKRGGFLPFLLPLLGALGALGGGAASIASAVTKAKSERDMLQETQRHNKAMETVKAGSGLKKKRKKRKGVKGCT